MNLSRRIKIVQICLWMHRARTSVTIPMIFTLKKLVHLTLSVGQAKEKRRIEAIKKAADNLSERTNSLMPELRTLNQLTGDRKENVLAARLALLEEYNYLQTICRNWVCAPPPGAGVLMYVLHRAQIKAVRRQRRCHAFSRLVSNISSDNFYWDLLLWLVVPSNHSEELLGDLNEEYLLRIASDGEARARTWYCDQVITTIRDYFWMEIEHLVAVWGLIDLVGRWFRK